jgi:hypothetical protein
LLVVHPDQRLFELYELLYDLLRTHLTSLSDPQVPPFRCLILINSNFSTDFLRFHSFGSHEEQLSEIVGCARQPLGMDRRRRSR